MSEQKRASSVNRGVLYLKTVTDKDDGVFFCDTQIIEEGVTWTFRTAVEVKAIRKYACVFIYVFLT